MPIKQILVPLTGESKAEHVCDMAFAVAKATAAHVVGTDTVTDPGPFLDQTGVGMMATYYDELMKTADKVQAQKRKVAAEAFDAARARSNATAADAPVKGNGVTATWVDGADYNGATVSLFGRLADLIVVNRPGDKASYAEMQVFETAVFTARKPVLVVPPKAKSLGHRAAIAWNGSIEACAAAGAAIDLMKGMDGVEIIQVGDIPDGNASSQALAAYLGWHGLTARIHAVKDAGKTGALILSEAKSAGASCLVMGAYTHSPLRELILGGVTSHMIGHSDLPLVMAH
ncbi:MAG: universal stress protein [Rhodospirillaceae bacterium]|nr:universal stress protein [Rhodospirillaceae bacterium]